MPHSTFLLVIAGWTLAAGGLGLSYRRWRHSHVTTSSPRPPMLRRWPEAREVLAEMEATPGLESLPAAHLARLVVALSQFPGGGGFYSEDDVEAYVDDQPYDLSGDSPLMRWLAIFPAHGAAVLRRPDASPDAIPFSYAEFSWSLPIATLRAIRHVRPTLGPEWQWYVLTYHPTGRPDGDFWIAVTRPGAQLHVIDTSFGEHLPAPPGAPQPVALDPQRAIAFAHTEGVTDEN